MIEVISAVCLGIGAFLVLSGGVGILRFPDFFARMHAASVTDTLAASLILIGLALQVEPNILVHSKLLFIFIFLMITSPTAAHALAKSALHGGIHPDADASAVHQRKKQQ